MRFRSSAICHQFPEPQFLILDALLAARSGKHNLECPVLGCRKDTATESPSQLVEETLHAAHREITETLARLAGERKRLEADLLRVQQDAHCLFTSTARGSLATARLAELEERQGRIVARLAEIEGESHKQAEVVIDPDQAKEALTLFNPARDILEPRERERLARLVIERIECNRATGKASLTLHPSGLAFATL